MTTLSLLRHYITIDPSLSQVDQHLKYENYIADGRLFGSFLSSEIRRGEGKRHHSLFVASIIFVFGRERERERDRVYLRIIDLSVTLLDDLILGIFYTKLLYTI